MRAGMRRCLVLLAVSVVIFVAAPAGAQTYSLVSPDGTVYFTNLPTRTYARDINEAAARYAVPERLIWAVIRAESGFQPRAVSRRGAGGLMQLMPETAAILGVRDVFDPHQNIDAGVRHLRALIERFGHDLRLAVAAYNAGEKAVLRYGSVPPYRETQQYVTRVLRFYDAPVKQVELPGGIHQIIERDGTIVYTNMPAGRPFRTGG
ncbi:MAG: lytic transglycosylase domain-containing protein [Candidatus Rokuibacteriota bacterium]|nr:MAG: lytic transglycosylase domain-containing protein [Candidatus Rokubacteria bacterium]